MAKLTVTNTTTSTTDSKDLNTDEVLEQIRLQLGTFMKPGDVFINAQGVPIDDSDLEPETYLRDIVKDSGFKIAGKAAADSPTPGTPTPGGTTPGTTTPGTAPGTPTSGDGPKQDTPGTKDPANNKPFTSADPLQPMELPEAIWAQDREGLSDGLVDGVAVESDQITQMKVGQVRALLKKNRIDLNRAKFGIAAAFSHNEAGDLIHSTYDGIECTEIEVKPADAVNITNRSYEYSEHVARLQRATTTAGDANVGVPEIFDVNSSYRTQNASRTDTRIVREHKSYCTILPKARVVFKESKISLSKEFISEIKRATSSTSPAPELLRTLGSWGQFFASDTLLGGRMNYWATTKLDQSYTEAQDRAQFELATKARAEIDGVPVKGGIHWGVGLTDIEKHTANTQASSLFLKIEGGNPALQKSPEKWIPTVAKYLNWGVAGFYRSSLSPTINYLRGSEDNDALRAKCFEILRRYFLDNLQYEGTITKGSTAGKKFGADDNNVSRIVQIKVNHGINVDSLQVTYQMKNGKHHEGLRIGWHHGENNDIVGPLDFDEYISSLEVAVGLDKLLRRVAFNTTAGRRFPTSKNDYYGRGNQDEKLEYSTIEAPRVCSIIGNCRGYQIEGIGLRFRDFKANTPWSDFMLDLEPYLFPSTPPAPINMSLPGILVAGKWRQQSDLIMEEDDGMRNILIVEIGGHSNHDGGYLQGLSNEKLIEMAAIIIFLKAAKILKDAGFNDRDWLRQRSSQEHRTQVTRFIHGWTGEPEEALRSLKDPELVRWGFTIKPEAAHELGKFTPFETGRH